MKTANSKILLQGAIDNHSIDLAFANIPTDLLKIAAQKMREERDWYGLDTHQCTIYERMIGIIRIVDPSFDTVFVSAL